MMENEDIERNVALIEEEKQEFLAGNDPEEVDDEETEEEDVEVEETEFSLTEEEIDEWINELTKLKEEKGSIELEVDDESNLKINYEEDEE